LKLSDLKRPFDYCISLGSNCMPAIQMNKQNLKQATLPFDWVVTLSTEKVAHLLLNKFHNYMEQKNLIIRHVNIKNEAFVVEDPTQGVESFHDFDMYRNTRFALSTYPEFREKLNRRIERLYKVFNEGNSFLFIRSQVESPGDARLLKNAIDQVVGPGKTAYLLIINCLPITQTNELEWGIAGVCTVEIPFMENTNYPPFLQLLQGITLTRPDSATSDI
jgi:hypothetical protein